ncbi:M24 family metallopeptidase [Haladaptatus caseinilyticus]|uniref:M24 family metallopeptidase n=1 Tax=Haladaptatus caseinilyticus TaxID=2993314 RepID=UPI003898FB7D
METLFTLGCHVLGVEGHEPPYLVEGNESILSMGNAFTIEPGIYVECIVVFASKTTSF